MGRVRSAVQQANKKVTIQLAAVLLAGSTLFSSLLGLLRDRLFNSKYLPNLEAGIPGYPTGADAYTVAFTLPDFMFIILVSGALSVTFIPVFNQRIKKGNKQSAWRLTTSLLNLMALVTLCASVLIVIFAEPLVRYVIAPGLDEASRALAVSMMRIIAINPFLFAIATVVASVQQAVGRFTFFALAPVIYNVGIIIGILFFTGGITIFGWQVFEGGIMGVALGVVLGSVMQLLVSSIGLLGLGFDYRFKIFWKNRGFRRVLSLLPARSVDQGMDYIVSLAEINLASRMASGTVRAYNQASVLHLMPISLIGVAISTAAFPSLTERLGEGRMDLFQKELRKTILVITWLALPIATITFFARGYIVNFIKNGGDPLMANLLGALVIAILFRSIYHIVVRAFYAQQDTKTPLYVSVFAIGLNIALAVWFTMALDWGPYGLAWAQSIVAAIEVVILFAIMSVRLPKLFNASFFHGIARMLSATGFMAVVTYITVQLFQLQGGEQTFWSTFPKFAIIVMVSGAAYVAICKLLKLEEVDPVINRIKKIYFGLWR